MQWEELAQHSEVLPVVEVFTVVGWQRFQRLPGERLELGGNSGGSPQCDVLRGPREIPYSR